MTVQLWLLIFLGPFLTVAVVGLPAAASWPGFLPDLAAALVRPVMRPRPRPVTWPARWAVA